MSSTEKEEIKKESDAESETSAFKYEDDEPKPRKKITSTQLDNSAATGIK